MPIVCDRHVSLAPARPVPYSAGRWVAREPTTAVPLCPVNHRRSP